MHLLIPAAGSGKRMGSERNKLLLPLGDRPVLAWTLAAAERASSITWIGLLGQPHDWPAFEEMLQRYPVSTPVAILKGGATRQESVSRGVKHLYEQGDVQRVLIHDGARCLASPTLFDRCSATLEQVDGLIAAIPVKDTIKLVQEQTTDPRYQIESTPDRSKLWAAQTPQGFSLSLLHAAHMQAVEAGWEVTDDAALFERLGLAVYLVEGEETNLKITTPLDLILAEQILSQRGL